MMPDGVTSTDLNRAELNENPRIHSTFVLC